MRADQSFEVGEGSDPQAEIQILDDAVRQARERRPGRDVRWQGRSERFEGLDRTRPQELLNLGGEVAADSGNLQELPALRDTGDVFLQAGQRVGGAAIGADPVRILPSSIEEIGDRPEQFRESLIRLGHRISLHLGRAR